MQRYLLAQKQIDAYYVEYLLSTAKPDVVDALTEAAVIRFREQGLQTAVVTESTEAGWLVSCIAISFDQAGMETAPGC